MKLRHIHHHAIAVIVYALLQVFWICTGGAQEPTTPLIQHIQLDSAVEVLVIKMDQAARFTHNEYGACITQYHYGSDTLYVDKAVPGKIIYQDTLHVGFNCPDNHQATMHVHVWPYAGMGPSDPDLLDDNIRSAPFGIVIQQKDHGYILILY